MDKQEALKILAEKIITHGETRNNRALLVVSDKDYTFNDKKAFELDELLGGKVRYQLKWNKYPTLVDITIHNSTHYGACLTILKSETFTINIK